MNVAEKKETVKRSRLDKVRDSPKVQERAHAKVRESHFHLHESEARGAPARVLQSVGRRRTSSPIQSEAGRARNSWHGPSKQSRLPRSVRDRPDGGGVSGSCVVRPRDPGG